MNIPSNKKVIMWILSTVIFIEMLDSTIINTAIPTMAISFQTNPINLKIAITSYLISLAIFIPISGWAANKYGIRTVFLSAIALFTISSVFCGLSNSIYEIAVFRGFQGLGGAMMTPVARLIMVTIFPIKNLVKISMYIFLPARVGTILGPFIGGILTTYSSWRWIFFINVPIGIIAFLISFKYIKNIDTHYKTKLDIIGFALSAVSLSCIALSMEFIGENYIPKNIYNTLLFTGIITFIYFIIHSIIAKEKAVLNFQLFKFETFKIGILSNMVANMSVGGVALLLPLLFQLQFKMSPLKSSLFLLPMAIGALFMRSISPKFVKKFGFKKVIFYSPVGIFISLILLSFVSIDSSYIYICFSCFCIGSFTILLMSSNGVILYVDIPNKNHSNATSLDVTSRQFASTLSIGISTFLLIKFLNILNTDIYSENGIKAFQYTFLILASIITIVMLLSLNLKKNDGEEAAQGAN